MIDRIRSWWRARRKAPAAPPKLVVHFAAGPFGWPVCGANTYASRTMEFGPAVTCPVCRRDGSLLLVDHQARTR